MLPKKHRLTRLDFVKNQSRETKYNFNCLLFSVKKGNLYPRFVIIVPKKTEKFSYRRHFLKRIIVELLRGELTGFTGKFDILIKVKRTLPGREIEYFKKEVDEFLTGDFSLL